MRGDRGRGIARAGPGALTQSVKKSAHRSLLPRQLLPPPQLSSCSTPPLVKVHLTV